MAAEPIQGFQQLQRRLAALGQAAGVKALRAATLQATLPAMQAIRGAVPTGTRTHFTYRGRYVTPGFLKRSIARKAIAKRDGTGAIAMIGMRTEAFYGGFVELGTQFMDAQPFLERGFASAKGAMINRLGERLQRQIERAAQSS